MRGSNGAKGIGLVVADFKDEAAVGLQGGGEMLDNVTVEVKTVRTAVKGDTRLALNRLEGIDNRGLNVGRVTYNTIEGIFLKLKGENVRASEVHPLGNTVKSGVLTRLFKRLFGNVVGEAGQVGTAIQYRDRYAPASRTKIGESSAFLYGLDDFFNDMLRIGTGNKTSVVQLEGQAVKVPLAQNVRKRLSAFETRY